MNLSYFLKRDKNNLDLFRLFAALMVIVFHAKALTGFNHWANLPLLKVAANTGTFAVCFFFFISGLVVCNSLIKDNNPIKFFINRIFRIFPALLIVLLLAAYVIGPIFTTLSTKEYLQNPGVLQYVVDNMKLNTNYFLPQLFTDNLYKNAVNGSLWTIRFEFLCYIFLLILYYPMSKIHKYAPSIMFAAFIVTILYFSIVKLESIFPAYMHINILCFFAGAILANLKDKIIINKYTVLICLGLFIFSAINKHTNLVVLSFCFLALLISFHPYVLKLRLKFDISYGVYLYGFVFAQAIYAIFKTTSPTLQLILTIILSLIFGLLSWLYVEKHAIKYGKIVGNFFDFNCFKSRQSPK